MIDLQGPVVARSGLEGFRNVWFRLPRLPKCAQGVHKSRSVPNATTDLAKFNTP